MKAVCLIDELYASSYHVHVAMSSEMTLKRQQFELFVYQYANSLMIHFVYMFIS